MRRETMRAATSAALLAAMIAAAVCSPSLYEAAWDLSERTARPHDLIIKYEMRDGDAVVGGSESGNCLAAVTPSDGVTHRTRHVPGIADEERRTGRRTIRTADGDATVDASSTGPRDELAIHAPDPGTTYELHAWCGEGDDYTGSAKFSLTRHERTLLRHVDVTKHLELEAGPRPED